MTRFKTLDDLPDIAGKRLLVRVDLNVPVRDGKVSDTTRIERVAPVTDARHHDLHRRLCLFHHARLHGRGVRPQHDVIGEIERVLLVRRRMIERRVQGREVITLINVSMNAGTHEVVWNGTNGSGARVASGMYVYTLKSADRVLSKKMVLMK